MAMWVKDDSTVKRWHEEFEEAEKQRIAEQVYILLKNNELKRYEAVDIIKRAELMILEDIAKERY